MIAMELWLLGLLWSVRLLYTTMEVLLGVAGTALSLRACSSPVQFAIAVPDGLAASRSVQ
jgi:hypothetical protein